MIYYILLFIALLGTDIGAKYMVTSAMQEGQSIALWRDVFHITYVRNSGAAFGIFDNNAFALGIVSVLIMVIILLYLIIQKPKSQLLISALVVIMAGGLGNALDRFRFSYVIDFFDFKLIHFAVFNTADTFVVCGTALIMLYVLFWEGKRKDEAHC